MSDDRTHYEVLGVTPGADKDELRTAYRGIVERVQADSLREQAAKRPNERVLQSGRDEVAAANRAWQVLSDPYQRGRYDASIGVGGPGPDAVTDAELVGPDESGLGEDGDDGDDGDDGAEVSARVSDRPAPRRSRWAEMEAMRRPVTTDDGTVLEIAANGRRATAVLIDVVTAFAVWLAIILIVGAATDFRTRTTPHYASLIGSTAVVGLAFLIVPTIRTGQTLGKRMTYLVMVDRATGQLPTARQVVRHLGIPIAFAMGGPSSIGIIGLFLALSFLMGKDGLSLLDRIAKTAVIVARHQPARPGR